MNGTHIFNGVHSIVTEFTIFGEIPKWSITYIMVTPVTLEFKHTNFCINKIRQTLCQLIVFTSGVTDFHKHAQTKHDCIYLCVYYVCVSIDTGLEIRLEKGTAKRLSVFVKFGGSFVGTLAPMSGNPGTTPGAHDVMCAHMEKFTLKS